MPVVFHRPRPDGHVGEQILHIAPVFRVEHFVCRGQAEFFDGTHLQPPHSDESGYQVGALFRVGLVGDALVTVTVGAGLIGVDSGYQHQPVLYLFLDPGQTADIVQHGCFIVRRTGSNDHQKLIGLAGNHIGDIPVFLFFNRLAVLGQGVLGTNLRRGGEGF